MRKKITPGIVLLFFITVLMMPVSAIVGPAVATSGSQTDSPVRAAGGPESAQSGGTVTTNFKLTNTESRDSGRILNLSVSDNLGVANHTDDEGARKPDGSSRLRQTIKGGNSHTPSTTVQIPETANAPATITAAVKSDNGAVSTPQNTTEINSSDPPEKITASLEPTTQTVAVGNETEFEIVVTGATAGIGEYGINITVDDTVVTPVEMDPRIPSGPEIVHSFSGPTVYYDFMPSFYWYVVYNSSEGRETITVGTITIVGDTTGEAPIHMSLFNVENADGGLYNVTRSENAELLVGYPKLEGNLAQNMDDDPRLEDVNGDNSTNMSDVRTFYRNYQTETVKNNTQSFDFNGDDEINLADVQALLSEIE